jgi:O-antigen/teichoic acid export membrane protein
MACQDFARYLGISRFNPMYAVWLDTAWLVLFVAAYVVAHHHGHVSVPWVFGEWAGTGATVGLFAMWNHLVVRSPRALVTFWFRSERSVGARFAGQFLVTTSWLYVLIYLLILVFSISTIGQFKLAQVTFGPVTVLSQGMLTAMVALAARSFQTNRGRALRFVLAAGLLTAGVMVVWTIGIYFAPVKGMTKAFGSAWPDARKLVPLTGLAFALSVVSSAAGAGLRALRAAKENLRLAIISVPLLLVGVMVGAVVWGVQAALAGTCIATGIQLGLGWWFLLRASRAPVVSPAVSRSGRVGARAAHRRR